ncbi:unnamed protein product, partial [Gadus morhua 'NCC']
MGEQGEKDTFSPELAHREATWTMASIVQTDKARNEVILGTVKPRAQLLAEQVSVVVSE